jgi:hypothetical protein
MGFLDSTPPRTDLGVAPGNSQVRSLASVIAICAAIASFVLSARGSAGLGFGLALVAIVVGILGGLRAVSPRVSGGLISMLAVALGAIAVLVSLVAVIL